MKFEAGSAIALIGLAVVAAAVTYWPSLATPTQQQGKGGGKGKQRLRGRPARDPVPVRATDRAARRRAGLSRRRRHHARAEHRDGAAAGRRQADRVTFTEGQDVQRGYVLAQIDPTTYQAHTTRRSRRRRRTRRRLANARLDLERYMRLAATNAIDKQQLDTQRALVAQLEAQVQLDQAAIDNARAILTYTNITAPIAGRTGIRQVDEGNIVRASDTTGIVVITQIQPISVLFTLPQQQLAGAQPRHGGRASCRSTPSAPTTARWSTAASCRWSTTRSIQTTGTVKLKAEFPNANLQLWPGQFVNVRLLIDTLQQVVVVPTAAVQRGPNGTFVFVVQRRQHGRGAAGDGVAAGRRAGGDRRRPQGRRARGDHGLRAARRQGAGRGDRRPRRPGSCRRRRPSSRAARAAARAAKRR